METPPSSSVDRIWELELDRLGYAESRLLAESEFDPFRRTYAHDGEVLKIVLHEHEISGHLRKATLEDEYRVLQRLRSTQCVPQPLGFRREQATSVLLLEHREGQRLDRLDLSKWHAVKVFGRLVGALFLISLRGVAHNDLTPDNILLNDPRITLLDFDQASTGSIGSALRSNFAFRSRGDIGRFGSLTSIARFLAIRAAPMFAARRYELGSAVHRARNTLRKNQDAHRRWPSPEELGTERLHGLAGAWRIASASNASSPGRPLAYYSLDVDGVRLPGERSWEQRWSYLSDATEYSGKRILELGCNMGLLSTWLLRHAGAEATYSVDHNPDIVRAAEMVAAVYGVEPRFAVVDFDRDDGWEVELMAFRPDIVTALNVDHWLREPERFLAFLARFPELVFEGHDSAPDEYRKLARLGFTSIRLITTSERGRPVFHATK